MLHFQEDRFSTEEESNFENDAAFSLPGYYSIGFTWQKDLSVFVDNEIISGHYGGKKLKYMKLWFLRAGLEKYFRNRLAWRFGLTCPVIAETSTLGNIRKKLPNPRFTLSAGCGYRFGNFQVDLALFCNPGMSYVEHKPVPSLLLTLIYNSAK